MKPSPFEYHAPETADAAVALLAEHEDAVVLAGGQSLVAMMNLRLAAPEHLVDINRIPELRRITREGEHIVIGAGVRQAEAEDHLLVRDRVPLLADALDHVAHREIRNAGTVGGSVAHADPAGEIPAIAVTLDAEVVAQGPAGERTIAADDFFVSYLTTALAPDELLVALRMPIDGPGVGAAFAELAPRKGDYALVGAAARIMLAEGRVVRAALGFLAVDTRPRRVAEAEAILIGHRPDPELVEEAARVAAANLEPSADLHATAAFRRHLAEVLGRRVLTTALWRAARAVPDQEASE